MLGPPLMPAVVGVPQETAVAISSLIMTDILGRFPQLKLVFSHGGGTIGAVIDRFNAVWKGFEAMRKALAMPPSRIICGGSITTPWYSAGVSLVLDEAVGAPQLIAGTDGPVDIGQPRVPILLSAAGIAKPIRSSLPRERRVTARWSAPA